MGTLVDQAKADDGRTLPLVDSNSLAQARQEIAAGGRGFAALAREALASGNLASAEKLAAAALRRDPKDPDALAVQKSVAANPGAAPAPAAGAPGAVVPKAAGPGAVVGNPGDVALGPDDPSLPPPDVGAGQNVVDEDKALEERLQKEVQNTINEARAKVGIDPKAAKDMIDQKMTEVLTEPKLRSEVKERLVGMLRAAGREVKRRGEEFVHREQARIQQEMAKRDQEMLNEALTQDQKKIDQLMKRFDSLMAEGRHRLAEESAAFEAEKVVQRSQPDAQPMVMAAAQHARTLGAYTDAMAVRVARHKGFLDSLYQTEKSHVPVPDDPPIVYPDAEAWKELTARRKEKYSAAELSRRSPAEKKIQETLKKPTQIEFVDTPLKDVVEYLRDLHQIEIQLDSAALKEAGVDESTPVTKNLKGVSLRSALKLMLDELQLKYVIHNDVLLDHLAGQGGERRVHDDEGLPGGRPRAADQGGRVFGRLWRHGRLRRLRRPGPGRRRRVWRRRRRLRRRHDGRHGRRRHGRHGRRHGWHGRRHDGRHGRHGRHGRRHGRHGRHVQRPP